MVVQFMLPTRKSAQRVLKNLENSWAGYSQRVESARVIFRVMVSVKFIDVNSSIHGKPAIAGSQRAVKHEPS